MNEGTLASCVKGWQNDECMQLRLGDIDDTKYVVDPIKRVTE